MKSNSSITYNQGLPMPMSVMANHAPINQNTMNTVQMKGHHTSSNASVFAGHISLQQPPYQNQGWNAGLTLQTNQQSPLVVDHKIGTEANSPQNADANVTNAFIDPPHLKLPNI